MLKQLLLSHVHTNAFIAGYLATFKPIVFQKGSFISHHHAQRNNIYTLIRRGPVQVRLQSVSQQPTHLSSFLTGLGDRCVGDMEVDRVSGARVSAILLSTRDWKLGQRLSVCYLLLQARADLAERQQ